MRTVKELAEDALGDLRARLRYEYDLMCVERLARYIAELEAASVVASVRGDTE